MKKLNYPKKNTTLGCILGCHRWKKIGTTEPIREVSEFVERKFIGHYALGECVDCGKRELRRVSGYWEWYHYTEVTKEQYMAKFESGEFQTG